VLASVLVSERLASPSLKLAPVAPPEVPESEHASESAAS
jgi:hypothetical protein